ncbi:fimbrial protein [Erwinia mallotivora]|uniref:fimbrial protein n=1 Tax=Erwinia mallotivora TaxID=69222 RepID=UPI0021BE0384|nr:fimbrial protein [Erwinia mallotivora]
MKLNKIAITAIMAFGMVSAAHAGQGNGTVTFTGSIIDAPCSISPESVYQVVEFGEVTSAALKDSGTSTPRPFQIKLQNCTFETASSVTTTFSGAESTNGLLGMTGNAKGASIAITDGVGSIVKLGEPTAKQQLQQDNNTLSFSAYLKGDGKDSAGKYITIVPGDFQSIADFTLAYQ